MNGSNLTIFEDNARELGERIGILMALSNVSDDLKDEILASLYFFSLNDIKRIHDALEARVVLHITQKDNRALEQKLENIARCVETEKEDVLNELIFKIADYVVMPDDA